MKPDENIDTKKLDRILWGIYAVVVVLAVYVWGVQLGWDIANLNALTVFPLFGLLAFSIMWVHYISGFIRDKWYPQAGTTKSYKVTTIIVLALILLHPTLLITQLYHLGYGLPPNSYKNYVAPGNVIFVLIGTLGLAGLLTFEFKRFFGKKSWWKYVAPFSDLGILLIALHSAKLGQHLQSGWFRYLWYFYIVTLVACIARIYYLKLSKASKKDSIITS